MLVFQGYRKDGEDMGNGEVVVNEPVKHYVCECNKVFQDTTCTQIM